MRHGVDGEGDEESAGASGRRFCCPDALAHGGLDLTSSNAQEGSHLRVVGLLELLRQPGISPRGPRPGAGT
jgi:hypothetical protein